MDKDTTIVTDIIDVALGVQEKLLVPNLCELVNTKLANELIQQLWHKLQNNDTTRTIIAYDINGITIRELIKTAFAEMGIEVEFSGRDKYEKAVVIDVDPDLAEKFSLSDALKPGQTVVRVAVLG